MRLIKKSDKYKGLKERYKEDPFGITRLEKGWNIKLGIVNKRPVFQKYIPDSKWECPSQGLLFALFVRDEIRKELKEIGLCNGSPATKKKPILDEKGKLRRLYLVQIQKNYCWKVHYKNKSNINFVEYFKFHKTGRVKQAFLAAVMLLRKLDIADNGKSDIVISHANVDRYLNAFLLSLDKNSDKFRYLRRFL